MTTIFEYIKQYIQYALSRLYTTRIGEVTNVDPTEHLVRVKIMPEAIITGWIPLLVPLLGVRGLPKIGDQAFVSYVFETPAAVLGFSYNNVDVTEATVAPNQYRITQGTGANKADLLVDGAAGKIVAGARLYASGPTTAPVDATLANSQWTAWVDETGSKLTFRVRLAGGTYKTGTVTLA